jgi:hypothetical protein
VSYHGSSSSAAPIFAAKPNVDPITPNLRDEGSPLAGYSFCNFLAPFEKRFCRLNRRQFADENKELSAGLHQYTEGERRIADTGIPTDGDPPAPANFPYPFLIGSVRPEVIVVPLKSHTGSAEKCWKLAAQISISEKYWLTRLVHMRARP